MSPRQILPQGSKFGRFEVLGRLAVGGMAEIYVARATGIEGFRKLVVIKRILPEHAENTEFVRMFLDEARLAALLHHPNVAQVYDIGTCDGSYFFAMEYVHGESVQKLLAACRYARREVPVAQAVATAIGVAAGLHHAHEQLDPEGRPLGIVHRDVSPSNVLVTYEGGVKVVDFGVAKAFEREARTCAGTLKGKVAYMSPEQCRGDNIDRRSDVFAIGIVLYELSTGARPFQAESEFGILTQIVNGRPPPPSAVRPDYPPGLERIVMRALRREPEERYATAQELQIDLEELAREQKLTCSPVALASFMEQIFGRKREAWTNLQNAGDSSSYVSISLVLEADGVVGHRTARGRLARLRRTFRRWPVFALLTLAMCTTLIVLGVVLWRRATPPTAMTPEPAPAPAPEPEPVPAPAPAPAPVPATAPVLVTVPAPEPAARPRPTRPRPGAKTNPGTKSKPSSKPKPGTKPVKGGHF